MDDLSIGALDDSAILRFAAECNEWLKTRERVGRPGLSPDAHTLWTALIRGEIELVTHAHRRLLAEMVRRRLGDAETAGTEEFDASA